MVRLGGHIAALSAFVLPLALSAQKPIVLGKPYAEFKEPFTQISAVRELEDGRVLVTDARERSVQLVDFKSGTATKVGREGSGPCEYILPQRIIALPGDTSAVYDPSNVRYLLIGPDGKARLNFSLEESIGGGRGRPGGTAPKGTDARGRIFYEGTQFRSTVEGGLAPADSAPVLRYDRATKQTDTIAYVHLARGNAQVSGAQGMVRMVVGRTPFPMRDEWAALPDGGVAVIRVCDYHVDWYPAAGKRTSSAPVRVTPVRVTEAKKKSGARSEGLLSLPAYNKAEGARRRQADPHQPLQNPTFPRSNPPFAQGEVFPRPNGEVWVQRSRRATDAEPVYDVFHPARTTVQVAFPARTRLAGFGNGTVYVVRLDEDDLQHLQRYSLQAMAPRALQSPLTLEDALVRHPRLRYEADESFADLAATRSDRRARSSGG